MRRLFLDIEVSPNIVLSWRVGSKIYLRPDNIISERKVISAAWKWGGERGTSALHWDENQDDQIMLRSLLDVMEEADEIVAYFGDGFDLPWLRTRFLYHGFDFPEYKTVDPCSWARRKFYFNSCKLDYVAQYLGFGSKLKSEDGLWKRVVMDRDAKSLADMVKYNRHDVILLEKVYDRLATICKPKTHVGVLSGGEKWTCPRDGSRNVKISKTRTTAAGAKQYQMQCLDCGGYFSINESAKKAYDKSKV